MFRYKAIWAWWQPNERKTGWCRRKPALDQWEGSLLQKGFLGPSLNQDYWGFSMWPFWRHGCCSNCLICYEEYCVYLSFALLSELQHFGLLSQYYRPLGSWSVVSTQRFSEKTDTIKTKICWRNQKVKTIIRMCCIIPRGMEVWIPMPHKIQNKKNHHLAQPGFPCLLLPLWTALLITI